MSPHTRTDARSDDLIPVTPGSQILQSPVQLLVPCRPFRSAQSCCNLSQVPSVPRRAPEMPRGSYNPAFQRRTWNSVPCPILTVKAPTAASIPTCYPGRNGGQNDEQHPPTTATQTCSRRTISATLSSSPTTSGFMTFQFSCGPGGAYFPTADVKPWPMRAPSRSMNHASRFPVSFAELTRAPQYLRGEHQLNSSMRDGERVVRFARK